MTFLEQLHSLAHVLHEVLHAGIYIFVRVQRCLQSLHEGRFTCFSAKLAHQNQETRGPNDVSTYRGTLTARCLCSVAEGFCSVPWRSGTALFCY